MTGLALGAVTLAGAQDHWGQDRYNRYGDRGYGDRGARYGDRGMRNNPAAQYGFEDGRRDGEHDFMTRHSFRPEHSGNFKHADHGYHGVFGDKRYYKEQYRASYMDGYRTGFRDGYRR